MATVASGTITHKLCQEQYLDGTIYDNLDDGNWGLELQYRIYPNTDYDAYTVAVRGRLRSDPSWRMDFNSIENAMILRLYCNGVNIAPTEKIDSFSIKEPSTGNPDSGFSIWYYWEYTPPSTGFSGISMSGECELFTHTGNTGYNWGPLRESVYNNTGQIVAFHLWTSETAIVTVDQLEPLATKPSITNLANGNRYNSQASISASTSSIRITWTNSTGTGTPTDVELQYKINGGSFTGWGSMGVVSEKTLTGLSARTTYVIQVRSKNSAGYSDVKEITIRTKSGAPTLTLTATSISLEQITFSWTSNYGLKSLKYKVGSGSNVSVSITDGATSGSFTVSGLSPGTRYTVTITGVETTDSVSNTKASTNTTLAKTTIADPNSATHSKNIVVVATKPSYPSSPAIFTTVTFDFNEYSITKTLSNSSNTFSLTESEWDSVYKQYGSSNSMTVKVTVTTKGVNTYTDVHNMTLKFTGIQKTAHVGGSDNKPKRAQIWVADSKKIAKRAVVWVGDSSNKPRRTI